MQSRLLHSVQGMGRHQGHPDLPRFTLYQVIIDVGEGLQSTLHVQAPVADLTGCVVCPR